MKRSKKSSFTSPASTTRMDVGLLLMRLGLGLTMLMNHGLPYLEHFESEAGSFLPLPGMNGRVTLSLVILAEVGGSLLLVAGLFARLAALVLVLAMAAAFFVVHGASFEGEQSGELAFIYLISSGSLAFTGPGRFAWNRA